MKDLKPGYNEPYPIPENLSLDVYFFFIFFSLLKSIYSLI